MAESPEDSVGVCHPEATLLVRISDAHPDPFSPKAFAQLSGVPLDHIMNLLDNLHQEGMIERRTPEDAEPGTLLVGLTPLGIRTAFMTGELERYIREHRKSLEVLRDLGRVASAMGRAWATRVLLGAMAVNFGIGATMAWQAGLGSDYLFNSNAPGLLSIYRLIGLFVPEPDLPSQWWRLLSAGFVHLGLVHILVNGFSLNSLGRLSEGLWGVPGFLLVFLVSVWSGFALAAAVSPGLTGGASGGICGLLGAMGSWVAINRGHMPAEIRASWTRALVTNGVLIGCMSLIPGVSGLGHLGGALGGAATGLGLALMARGRSRRQVGVMVLLASISAAAWLGRVGLDVAASSDSAVKIRDFEGALADRAEIPELNKRLVPSLARHIQKFREDEDLHWHPLLQRDKFRRNEKAAEAGARLASESVESGGALAADWKSLEVRGTVSTKARDHAVAVLAATGSYAGIVADCLSAGREWPMERDKEISEKRGVARKAVKAWEELLEANRGDEAEPAAP